MPNELDQLFQDLDFDRLRAARPSKFIFFCGGATSDVELEASSLRHFLLNDRKIGRKFDADVVLAERANQLYRDTPYRDLITFEEDIAKISACVLVIAESSGSLAELGAFASNDTICQSLSVILQEKYAETESFVRYGPVERVRRGNRERVGVFPWETNGKGRLIKSSAEPHLKEILKFINEQVSKTPRTTLIANSGTRDFLVLYWLIYLSKALTVSKLVEFAQGKLIHSSLDDVRKKLFCMELAGWLDKIHYSNVDYHCCRIELDPFEYTFRAGVAENDSLRRKTDVALAIQRELKLPKHVTNQATTRRQPAR